MSRPRTWSQRLLLALNCLVIVACFGVAAGLLITRHYGNNIVRVDLPSVDEQAEAGAGAQPDAVPEVSTGDDVPEAPSPGGPVETFPTIDPEALNFLITGADNNACIEPDSPFAGAFGDRGGERSDTVMVLRIDPASKKAAVLSFPRDLWVNIPGRSPNRINSAYERNDPTRLIGAINENFGLTVDHFVQVDFCAFKHLVDTVGGVTVPFAYPAKDTHTGLNVPEAGCFTFSGDHALAYVRSRHYQYFDDGKWTEDPASDLGRISRQQDFLGRVLSSALAKGLNPGVARGIIDAVKKDVVVDNNLTPGRMLEIAGIVSDFEPGDMATYQVAVKRAKIGSNDVLLPQIKGENMQAILAIFRGDAPLADAPQQEIDTTTSIPAEGPSASAPSTVTVPTETTTVPTETTVAPPVGTGPEQQVLGIVPPDEEC